METLKDIREFFLKNSNNRKKRIKKGYFADIYDIGVTGNFKKRGEKIVQFLFQGKTVRVYPDKDYWGDYWRYEEYNINDSIDILKDTIPTNLVKALQRYSL